MIKELFLLKDKICVCKLVPSAVLPSPPDNPVLWSLSVTSQETSLVCSENIAPPDSQVEGGWRAFMVKGPLEFSLTGIVANLSDPLAKAGIPVFIISTFETDYLLVKDELVEKTIKILKNEWKIST